MKDNPERLIAESHEPRPVKIFLVTPECVASLLIDGAERHFKIVKGFPLDSKLVDRGYIPDQGAFYLTVESATFPLVKPTEKIPFAESPLLVTVFP